MRRPPPPLPTPAPARGFTLIELMVAVAIMALVAVLSWRGIDGMVRAQAQTRERADAVLTLQAALGQWNADLDALVTLPHTQPIDWDGQALRLTRRGSGLAQDAGAFVVAWARRGGAGATNSPWLRWQSQPLTTRAEWQQAWQQAAQWARNPGDAERRAEVALLPATDWQVFYYRGDAWTSALSSAGASSTAVPDGVRLVLTLAPGPGIAGPIVRDWINPLKGGGKAS